MVRIAHLSDLHFGRIAYPDIVAALVEAVNASAVDLVVVSGDLTQRARPWQFREAAVMLDAFAAPVLVVPGNHDIYAWWHRPFLRMFQPLRRYRHYVSDELAPTFESDAVAVLGINSAYGCTIKGGWVPAETSARIGSFFSKRRRDVFKVLVLHHHLMRIDALGKHDVARRARPALEAAARAGVDLILCGHLHVAHVEPVEPVPGRRLVIASAGTATCDRWRAPQLGVNTYTVIAIDATDFFLEKHRYDPRTRRFGAEGRKEFKRCFLAIP